MRILLSGSTGFIGRALAEALSARGETVVRLSREPGPGEIGIDLERGRLELSRLDRASLGGLDAAVHLAGAPILRRWSARQREAIMSSRVALGHLLARYLGGLEERPRVYVTGSAVGYYGDRGEELLDEESSAGSGFLADVCRAWEASAAPAAQAGIRTVAVRSGIVLGRGGALKAQLPLFRAGLGARLGTGRQWTSWISLEDEVGALLRAVDDERIAGPLNAVSPNPVRNSELTATLARLLNRPALLFVPAPLLRLGLGRGPADEMLLASQRVRPAVLERAGFAFSHPELEGALRAVLAR